MALIGAVVAATSRRRDRKVELPGAAPAPREPIVRIAAPDKPKVVPVAVTEPPAAAAPASAPASAPAQPEPAPDPTPLPKSRAPSERPSSEVAVIVDVPISAPNEEERNARLAKLPLQALDLGQPTAKPVPTKSTPPAARPTPPSPARPRAASHPGSVETAPTELAATDTDVANEPTAVRAVEAPRSVAISEESAITAIVAVKDVPVDDALADTLPPESSEAAKALATSLAAPRNTDRGHAQVLKKPALPAAPPPAPPVVPPAPPLLPARGTRESKPLAAPLKPAPTPKPAVASGPPERPTPMPVPQQRSSKTTIPPDKTTVGTPIPPRAPNPAAKSQPGKLEPAKPEAAKPEAAKPEAAKPEAAKPEAAKPEPAKREPSKPEASKPEPSKPEASKPEASKPEPAKAEPAKPDDDDEEKVSTAVREVVAPPDAARSHADTDNTGLEGGHELPNDPTLVTPMEIAGVATPAAPPVVQPPPPKPLPPGARRLGAYVVMNAFARAPDGPIYASHDDARDRDVHVETLPSDLDLVAFATLVQTLSGIDHADLVRAYELVLHAGKPYLVREPHANRTLEDVVKMRRRAAVARGGQPRRRGVRGARAPARTQHRPRRGAAGLHLREGKACKLGGVGVPPSLFHRIGLAGRRDEPAPRRLRRRRDALLLPDREHAERRRADPRHLPGQARCARVNVIAENPTDRPSSIPDVRAKFRALTA